MSSTSRVPLLVGNKGRKPSRLPIAPRARPSNVDRTKRPSSPQSAANDDEPTLPTSTHSEPHHSPERKALPAVLPVSTISVAPTPVAVAPRGMGGISPGHSISAARLGTLNRPQPVAVVAPTRSSPLLSASAARAVSDATARSPGQSMERLSKITAKTTVPLFRPQERTHASPILGPRATPIPAPHGPQSETSEQNPLLKRLTRKLDIKPHQSPRRAALHQHPAAPTLTASPLMLAAPSIEVPAASLDKTAASPGKRGTKRRNPDSAVAATKPRAKKPLTPRRSIKRKVKKDVTYKKSSKEDDESDNEGASDDDYDDNDDDDDEDFDENDSRRAELNLPELETPQVYMPARERATLWAKKVLRDQEAAENGEVVDDASKKAIVEVRKRSNSTSSVTSLSTNTTNTSRKSKTPSERLQKEPSQMTMGEFALSIPKGRRMVRHEQEELPDNGGSVSGSHRIRSLSMSSETPSFAGSIVTPQVEIIDGKMVISEATVKLTENSVAEYTDDSGRRPRGSRYLSANMVPGRRWSKDETKQFYYCLSQVGPNFSMMATLFPSRKRKELKSKFKYEEKNHPDLIEIALQASAAPLDSEIVDVIGQIAEKEIKKKEAKRRKNSTDSLDSGLQSPATVSSSNVVPSPPPEDAMDYTEDHFGDFYRERKGSFDFAG